LFNLKALEIENFRSFQKNTRIEIDDLTTIIGKNDAGKSTLLEALEIFFNNELVKLETNDANVFSDNSEVSIKCIFENVDYSIILDDSAETYLKDEYLLNQDNNLEVLKVYNTDKKTIKPEVYIKAMHPTNTENPLINFTQTQLKQKINELNINDEEIKYNSNVSMRKGIYRHFTKEDIIEFEDTYILLSKQDGVKLWNNLLKKLPIFALFKADRPSNDEDSEVQDPMKLAVNHALTKVEQELDEIKEKVKEEAIKTANTTLEKLHEMDESLASELIPDFSNDPKWNNLFKLSLENEHGISINKRGSGVRRLILLNFFRAEVERQRSISERGVIYAIEEPETAQHPDNQKMLIDSLKDLAAENSQILITAHVPGVAELLPVESIRFICEKSKSEGLIDVAGDAQLSEIADDLGVIPSSKVKLILYVEGKNDVYFFRNLSDLLHKNGVININLLTDKHTAIIPTGGVDSLKDFINKRYLENLGLPGIYIVDKDEGNNKVKSAIVTKRREMENYIHHTPIKNYFENKFPELVDVPYNINFQDADLKLPKELCEHLNRNLDKSENNMPPKEGKIKTWLNRDILPNMTLAELKSIDKVDNISAFEEIKGWFQQIEEKLST